MELSINTVNMEIQKAIQNAISSNGEETKPFKFDWVLDGKKYGVSIFEKKKMVEYVDVEKVYGFIHANMGINYSGIKKYAVIPYHNELEWMKNYKTLYDKKAKVFNIGYTLPKHKWGRINPNDYLSLCVAQRATRHSLCDGQYVDIDMINAHPVIISEICKHHKIKVPFLCEYIEKREVILAHVMNTHGVTRDVAKNLPIIFMFGGSYNGWMKEHNVIHGDKIDKMEGMENELMAIMEIVYTNNKHIETAVLKQEPTKWKTDAEKKRGVMALWSQTIERQLQESAISHLVRSYDIPIEEIVPCQDGFMIRKKYYEEKMIDDINQLMIQDFNINVQFKVKPFDEKYDITPYSCDKTYAEWTDLLSVKKLADRFMEEFNKVICFSEGNLYIYWGEKEKKSNTINGRYYEIYDAEIKNGRWYNETDEKKRYKFILYISNELHSILWEELAHAVELDDTEFNNLFKLLRNNTSGNKIKDVITHILPNVQESTRKFNSDPFLLGFENGVFDLTKNEFRSYTFNDYLTMSTGYDYKNVDYGYDENGVEIKDQDVSEEIRKNRSLRDELVNIIETIQPNPEERELFCQILASGLDGKLYQKMYLFNGQGGNGKGLTSSLMNNILGDYFVAPTNGLLKEAEKPNSPSPDMLSLKHKRYVNFKEVGGNIKSAIVRNFTGGGDFYGRKLQQNPEKFRMTATFVMEFNNAPDLEGKPQASDYRRLTHIEFPVNFTDNPNKIDKVIGGIQYKKANPYYETESFVESMRYVFLNFLIQVYTTFQDKKNPENGIVFNVPRSVLERSEKFVQDQDLFNRVFFDQYEKVDIDLNNKADIKSKTLKMRDMWEVFECSKEYRKLTAREQREYSRDECYKWIESNFKVEKDKKVMMVYGIQKKYIEDENEIYGDDGKTEV